MDSAEIKIEVGTFIHPDGWQIGEKLAASDGYKDSSFPGCEFRLPSKGGELAVNIAISGRVVRTHAGSWGWVRVKIEFVGDGEPSTMHAGWAKVL